MKSIVSMIGLLLLTVAPAGAVDFYVATGGNDAWTGRLPEANEAKTDGPFATLHRARDAVRRCRGEGASEAPFTVSVRAGDYFVGQTLVFTAEDSGTERHPVTFRSYPGETVRLVGAKPVRGWSARGENVCVAALADQGFERFRFHQVFFRGKRQTLARHPNLDPAHPHTGGLLYVDAPSYLSQTAFHYGDGEIPFASWGDFLQAEVNLFPYNCWDHNIIPIIDVDPRIRHVKLRLPVAGRINEANRYFVENVLGALDAPGEWYVDYATGELHFFPPQEPVKDGDVLVPVLENLVEISGSAEEPVEYFRFHGFHLAYAEQDGITLEGARFCEITGNVVSQVGGVGVNVGYLRNARRGIGNRWRKPGRIRTNVHSGDRALLCSHACTGCRIAGNDVFSTGGDGITLVGTENVADNNHVYRTGRYDMVSAGVTVIGEGNVVSHNEIHDLPRDAVFLNGAKNTAEYNSIRNTMLYTADNSAIALRQHNVERAVQDRGNVIRFNKILDTIGYGSYPHCTYPPEGYGSPYCSWGIYLDGSISGVSVYGNIIARSGANSIFIQFGGGNVVENNIFVETLDRTIQLDSVVHFGWFMHSDPQGRFQEPPNEIRRNIFYYTGKDKKLYLTGLWGHPEWNAKQAVFDHNVIWHGGLPIEVELDAKRTYRSLLEWQAAGHDRNSIVADPGFVDAANDDYRLRPDSPAFGIGFQNINDQIAKIGAYESPDRATWPLENLVLKREQPVVFQYMKPPKPIIDGFELTPLGSPPARAQVQTEGAASIEVAEGGSSTGSRSLRFRDAAHLEQVYNPHLVYALNYPPGKLRFSVDICNSKDAPAQWYMEFRDWRDRLFVGPTFAGSADGTLTACGKFGSGGRELAVIPKGTGFTVDVAFESGPGAPKTYTLTLRVPGQEDRAFRDLPFVDDGFVRPTWLGICSMSDAHTVFHVDNLLFGPADAEDMQRAIHSPAIRGLPGRSATTRMQNNDQLALYWKCDEARGYKLADSSGNGLEGNLGGTARAKGDFGHSLYLDGSGGFAELEDSPLIQLGASDFTIECYLCPTMLEVDSPHKRRRLLDKGLYPDTWWNLDVTCDGRIHMEMTDADKHPGTTESDGAVRENAWTHLAVVVDRKNFQTRYYLNGRRDSTKDLPAVFAGSLDMVGKSLTTGNWQPFIGLLDELKIYKRVVTERESEESFQRSEARYTSPRFTVEWD
ncbi:MAG: LamG-like jellyroll fold domain-containing protein [Planctomycetota bacterium]